MKKSIAFLGALLFGSVTFGQVTKNDSIKKPSSRKVTADDLKKFPKDAETVSNPDYMKLESTQKHIKYSRSEKHSSDASAGQGEKIKGSVTQKGRENKILVTTTEKQSSDITTAPISNFKGGAIQKANAEKSGITTEKQSYDVDGNPISSFKGGAIQKSQVTEKNPIIEKVGGSTSQSTKASDVFIKIGDIKGEKDDK